MQTPSGWPTIESRRWININDVDSTSQQRHVPSWVVNQPNNEQTSSTLIHCWDSIWFPRLTWSGCRQPWPPVAETRPSTSSSGWTAACNCQRAVWGPPVWAGGRSAARGPAHPRLCSAGIPWWNWWSPVQLSTSPNPQRAGHVYSRVEALFVSLKQENVDEKRALNSPDWQNVRVKIVNI